MRRPSELYGLKSPENPDGLDETAAFAFDAALALRYSAIANEEQWEKMNYLKNGMRAIIGAVSHTNVKDVPFVKKVGNTGDKAVADSKPKATGLFSVFGRKTAIEKVKRK